MFARIWQSILRVDRLADAFSYWLGCTLFGGIGLAMTWLTSQTTFIADHGWGAIILAGIVVTCLLAFAMRAILSIVLYFWPPTLPVADAAIDV